MRSLPTSNETAPTDGVQWSEPAVWRTVDDHVELFFGDGASTAGPERLRWRGVLWHVVGTARSWSTWHSLAVDPAGDPPPTCRGLRTRFWRFAAQTAPVGPVLHFEVRGSGDSWRLVRLGAAFDLPAPS